MSAIDLRPGARATPSSMTAAALLERLRAGRRVVVATLVEVEGSAPLPLGATMLVDEDGAIEGSVTGGCVESALVELALAILHGDGGPEVRTFGISDALAGAAGLTCGGTVHVFVHAIEAADAPAVAAYLATVAEERPAGLATLLDGPQAGAALAVADGRTVGSLRGEALLDRNAAEDLHGLIAHGRSATARYGLDGSKLGAEQRVHLQAFGTPPQMVVVGAIDFSAALAPLARALGYRVTIADPRAAFARSPRFSSAAEVVVAWPQAALAGRTLGPRDAVLVFSHDPKLDVPALMAALGTGAGYVGALGSRRTTADRERRLREAGATEEQLARVFAPCGLDIGSATAEETAIAVLAEIVAQRAGRAGGSLRDAREPIRPRHGS